MVRIREILSYSDIVNGKFSEGYCYSSGLNTHYIYAPRLYKYNDTYAKILEKPLVEAPAELWKNLQEVKELGSTIVEGKIKTILSDGTISDEETSTPNPPDVVGGFGGGLPT